MVTFDLTATCPDCGSQLRGVEVAHIKRVNLGNIRTDWSMGGIRFCPVNANHGMPTERHSIMRPKDLNLIEAQRNKIRARQKKVAA